MYVKQLMATALVLMAMDVSGQISWNHRMFKQLPRPEEIERATTVAELRPYLERDASVEVQWAALFKVAEIGGDEAADALYEFYKMADSACGDDSGELPKAGAIRLLGAVGGENAKELLLGVLDRTVREGRIDRYPYPLLAPLEFQIVNSAIDGLSTYSKDEEVLQVLRLLALEPPEQVSATLVMKAEAALLRMQIRRSGVDSLGLSEQVVNLLRRVTGPGFGSETWIAPGRFTDEAVLTEAVRDVLCYDYGSGVLTLVEEYVEGSTLTVDSRARAGLEEVMAGLRACGWGEDNMGQALNRALAAYCQPGMRLVIRKRGGLKQMVLVPADSTAEDSAED